VSLGGTGQTISAPHMVVIMLEELALAPHLKVLEIGGGSGYNAAVMGHMVSAGRYKTTEPLVFSVERVPELAKFAERNIDRLGMSKVVRIVEGDGSLGYPQESSEPTYDRILVAAGAPRIPYYLKKQLKYGGLMEVPVGGFGFQKLKKFRKDRDEESGRERFSEEDIVDCAFVPLVGQDAHGGTR
jgi:protein-L-isoaspartate(D-aspartate) O-methyltransferase